MITEKQKKLLLFIKGRLSETYVSPSFEEMKVATKLKSKSGVHRLINALEERGFIRRIPNKARALELLRNPDGSWCDTSKFHPKFGRTKYSVKEQKTPFVHNTDKQKTKDIFLLGKLSKKSSIAAISTPQYSVDFPRTMLLQTFEYYALEVKGNWGVEMSILNGDTLLIEKCNTARSGDKIIVILDEKNVMLRILHKIAEKIYLQGLDKKTKEVYCPKRIQIHGRLVGLLRKY